MLKLTYTESNFHVERLAQSLEAWVATRVSLALRMGQPLCFEPSTATFLLPAKLTESYLLAAQTQREEMAAISLCACDAEYVEVSLRGVWLRQTPDSEEGIFVTVMSDRTEFFLLKLWQEAQACVSSLKP